jgi:hypothetical protein
MKNSTPLFYKESSTQLIILRRSITSRVIKEIRERRLNIKEMFSLIELEEEIQSLIYFASEIYTALLY